jgi:vacuolar protein sorting-associated protein 16
VSKFLFFPEKLRSLIYVDWAKCKIEQSENDESLCAVIRDKLKDEKGISYTEIAQVNFQ